MSVVPMYQTRIPEIQVVRLGAPLFAQMELTAKCSYRCRFCYNVWKDGASQRLHRLSHEQAMLVADKLIGCQIFSVILSGGEPTLADYLPELIKKFVSSGIDVTIITNGSRLTRSYLVQLKAAGLESMQISMHHYDPALMDMITGQDGSYAKTLRGVQETLQVFGSECFSVNMVVTKDTLVAVTPMGEFLHQQGVTQFSVGMVSFSGLAAVNHLAVNRADLLVVYRQLEELHNRLALDVALTGGLPLCLVPGNGEDGVVTVSNVCDAGIHQIVVGPDGGLRPCVEMPIVVGNIFQDDLVKVWQTSPELTSIRQFENVPPSCYGCKLVGDCHGGCRASALLHSGDPCGPDPLMEVAR